MSARIVPAHPSLEHLEHEAKVLHRAVHHGYASAVTRVRAMLGDA